MRANFKDNLFSANHRNMMMRKIGYTSAQDVTIELLIKDHEREQASKKNIQKMKSFTFPMVKAKYLRDALADSGLMQDNCWCDNIKCDCDDYTKCDCESN